MSMLKSWLFSTVALRATLLLTIGATWPDD